MFQAQQQGKASLPRSVRVPKAATDTSNTGASRSTDEANSGSEAEQQKGSSAPTTPPKKATRAIPSSPTSLDSSDGPRFCHCCCTIGKPYLCCHANKSPAALPCLGQYLRLAKTPPVQAFNTLLQPLEFKTGDVGGHVKCSMHYCCIVFGLGFGSVDLCMFESSSYTDAFHTCKLKHLTWYCLHKQIPANLCSSFLLSHPNQIWNRVADACVEQYITVFHSQSA